VLSLQIGNAVDGKTLTQDQAIRRWLALFGPSTLAQLFYGFSFIGWLVSLAAFAWVIFLLWTTAQSPTKQGWHDHFANTMIVKAARIAG
jgi:RDD family